MFFVVVLSVCIVSTARVDALALISYCSVCVVNSVSKWRHYSSQNHCFFIIVLIMSPVLELSQVRWSPSWVAARPWGAGATRKLWFYLPSATGTLLFFNVLDIHNSGFCRLNIDIVYLSFVGWPGRQRSLCHKGGSSSIAILRASFLSRRWAETSCSFLTNPNYIDTCEHCLQSHWTIAKC